MHRDSVKKPRRAVVTLALALAAVPFAVLVYRLSKHGMNFPYWDEMLLVQFIDRAKTGQLRLIDFWTQHNQKVAEQRQGQIALAELRDQVHLEVRKAHKDLRHWQEEWPKREKEYRALRSLYGAAGGASGGLSALRVAVRLLSARRRYLEAVTEHILSRARLERAIGRKLPSSS